MKISPQLKYYRKNRKRILAKRRLQFKNPFVKQQRYEAVRKWRVKNQDKFNEIKALQNKRYRKKYPEKVAKKCARQYKELRLKVLNALGGVFCKKCNFKDYRALQIDHINGGGMKHIRSFSSNKTYLKFVIKNPSMFQVLCANCNRIKVYENNEMKKYANKD